MYAFNLTHQTFREIQTALPDTAAELTSNPVNICLDENAVPIVYLSTDFFTNSGRKVYSFGISETDGVSIAYETPTITLTDDAKGRVVRYVALTYKSGVALRVKVWLDNEITSGNIQPGVLYYVDEYPYVNGSTFSVTYNGTAETHGHTFTGVAGKGTYSVTAGAGNVMLYKTDTYALNNAPSTVKLGIHERAKKIRVRIESIAASTTAVEIHRLTGYLE